MLVENPTYTDFINNHYKSTGELLNPKDYSTFQSFMQKQQKSIRGAYTKKNSDNITDIMTDNSYRDTGGDVGDLLKTEGGKYSSNSVGVAEDYMKFAGDKTKGVKSYIGEVETNFNIPKDIPIEDALKAYRQQILPNSGNLTEIPNEFLRKKGFTVKENPYSTVSKPAYERSSISGTDNLNLTGLEYKGKNLAKNKNFGINAESSESYFSPNKFGDSFSDKKLMLEYLDTKPIGKINYTNKAKELAPVTQERMYPYFYNELYKNKINTLQEQLSNT